MTSFRCNPGSEENQRATRQNQREVFALNQFASLSAESPESRLAQMSPEEHQECQDFLDSHVALVPDP